MDDPQKDMEDIQEWLLKKGYDKTSLISIYATLFVTAFADSPGTPEMFTRTLWCMSTEYMKKYVENENRLNGGPRDGIETRSD